MKKIKAIRGMNDLLPEQSAYWQYLELTVASLLKGYGYREIRMPILESTELFKRTIGEVTDIIEKEMYTFEDRKGESVSMRPEGTAGCVRAGIEHGLLFNQVQRLWYTGPMFRYERPQKGRLRQFHQIGVETFGLPGAETDAEMILMTARLWKQLGIEQSVTLQVNSLGTIESRTRYREALVTYLSERKDQLDEDSLRRLDSNPLRILDSKDPSTQALLDNAPVLTEYLDEESATHFKTLLTLLDAADISYEVNPRLVRGLDYYCKTVFEWVTDRLGAQGTVCAGGRYDGLVEQLGGKATSAVGFAMGVERLTLLLEELSVYPEDISNIIDVYFVAVGDVKTEAVRISESIRDANPTLRLQVNYLNNFKHVMKKAKESRASIAVVLGENEMANREVSVLYLSKEGEQEAISFENIQSHIGKYFS